MWGNIPYFREDDTDFRKADIATAAGPDRDPQGSRRGDRRSCRRRRATVKSDASTQWTAKAYKGRVQMYAGSYRRGAHDAARSRGRAACTRSSRATTASGPAIQDSRTARRPIFAYQASANDGEPNGNNANYGERLNFPHSGSPFGCCGFHQPSQNLVNYFVDDAARPADRAVTNAATWNASNAELRCGDDGGHDGRSAPGLDGRPRRRAVQGLGSAQRRTGSATPAYGGLYSAKKNVHEKSSGAQSSVGWVNTQLNSVNIHILRYADVLLLLAEAEVEAGSLENARTIVNQIRHARRRRRRRVREPTAADASRCRSTTRRSRGRSTGSACTRRLRRARRPLVRRCATSAGSSSRWRVSGSSTCSAGASAETTLNGYVNGVGGGAEKNRRPHLAGGGGRSRLATSYFPIPTMQIAAEQRRRTARVTQNPGW